MLCLLCSLWSLTFEPLFLQESCKKLWGQGRALSIAPASHLPGRTVLPSISLGHSPVKEIRTELLGALLLGLAVTRSNSLEKRLV